MGVDGVFGQITSLVSQTHDHSPMHPGYTKDPICPSESTALGEVQSKTEQPASGRVSGDCGVRQVLVLPNWCYPPVPTIPIPVYTIWLVCVQSRGVGGYTKQETVKLQFSTFCHIYLRLESRNNIRKYKVEMIKSSNISFETTKNIFKIENCFFCDGPYWVGLMTSF